MTLQLASSVIRQIADAIVEVNAVGIKAGYPDSVTIRVGDDEATFPFVVDADTPLSVPANPV